MYVRGLIMLEGKTSSQLVSPPPPPPPCLTHSASFASWYGVLSSDGSQPSSGPLYTVAHCHMWVCVYVTMLVAVT